MSKETPVLGGSDSYVDLDRQVWTLCITSLWCLLKHVCFRQIHERYLKFKYKFPAIDFTFRLKSQAKLWNCTDTFRDLTHSIHYNLWYNTLTQVSSTTHVLLFGHIPVKELGVQGTNSLSRSTVLFGFISVYKLPQKHRRVIHLFFSVFICCFFLFSAEEDSRGSEWCFVYQGGDLPEVSWAGHAGWCYFERGLISVLVHPSTVCRYSRHVSDLTRKTTHPQIGTILSLFAIVRTPGQMYK